MTDVMVHMNRNPRIAVFLLAATAACAAAAAHFSDRIFASVVHSLAGSSGFSAEMSGVHVTKGPGISAEIAVRHISIRRGESSLEGRANMIVSMHGIAVEFDRGSARAAGLEFEKISFKADAPLIERHGASVQSGSAALFEGLLSVPLFHLRHGTFDPFRVLFSEISINSVLTRYAPAGVRGSGSISGEITISSGPAVPILTGGIFQSVGGGTIAVNPGGVALPAHPGSDLLARALEDFRYSDLHGTVTSDKNGTMKIAAVISGVSPRVDAERPLVLNLTIEENIPKLIESLKLL